MEHTILNEELLEEVLDVKSKLEDIIEFIENDKELDDTQKAFLQYHKII
jgi:hypothetical protein